MTNPSKRSSKSVPVLVVAVERPNTHCYSSQGFFHVTVTVARLTESEDGLVGPSAQEFLSPQEVNGLRVRGLTLGSQGHNGCSTLYGWEHAEFRDVDRASLGDLLAMARTLRLVQDKTTKLEAKLGPARTFGEQVVRLARALGARRIFWLAADANPAACVSPLGYRSCEVRADDDVARNIVDHIVAACLKVWGKQPEPPAYACDGSPVGGGQ